MCWPGSLSKPFPCPGVRSTGSRKGTNESESSWLQIRNPSSRLQTVLQRASSCQSPIRTYSSLGPGASGLEGGVGFYLAAPQSSTLVLWG